MLEYAHQQTADKDREIEELKAEVTALKLVIDELTDGDCLKQSKAKLSGELNVITKYNEELRSEIAELKAEVQKIDYEYRNMTRKYKKAIDEVEGLKAEVERLKQQRYNWAGFILKVRDALVENDVEDAFHWLYQIASPNFDKYSDEVWKEIEELATTLNQQSK
jgi:cell division protein FtsB